MPFATCRRAKDEVIDWLPFYNHRRLHSTPGYLSPMAFEKTRLAEKGRARRIIAQLRGNGKRGSSSYQRASSPASEPWKPSQTVICRIAMPEAVHAVAAYRHATPLSVRVTLRRIAKPHAVAAIVRRRDAPAARWRGDASTARWRSAIHPRSEAARRNCQRQSSAAYDFNQFFQAIFSRFPDYLFG